jgi:hypothetical protein
MYISINKHRIACNNKNNWVNPLPCIRVSKTKSSKGEYCFYAGIQDEEGNIVAEVIQSNDGAPLLNCGAKIVIKTSPKSQLKVLDETNTEKLI